MAEANIKCPVCKKTFTLKTGDLANLNGKMFTCPGCKQQTPFAQLLNFSGSGRDVHQIPSGYPARGLHTQIGASPAIPSGNKTQVAANRQTAVMLILDQPFGKVISLPAGVHTLGRDSSDSGASVRIAPDPYMSRLHARLEVVASPGGNMARIGPIKPANPVFVNNQRVSAPDCVRIKNGDVIRLGDTTMTLRI